MAVLINITGPIASGATTLAKRLVELMLWENFLEADVEKTNSFFSLYSINPQRYAFHNQVTFLVNSAELHHRLHTDASKNIIYVQDFCPFEHTHVYAYVQYIHGYLSKEEYALLLRLTSVIEPHYIVPQVLVYRPLSQEKLLKRVQERGRSSEQSIDLKFLDSIQGRFEEWIGGWTRSPVIRVDESTDFFTDTAAVDSLGRIILKQLNRNLLI